MPSRWPVSSLSSRLSARLAAAVFRSRLARATQPMPARHLAISVLAPISRNSSSASLKCRRAAALSRLALARLPIP